MAITRNNTKSKSSLFLLELAVAIVFFALASVICIQLFVKSHTLSRESSEMSMAVVQAQSVAEAYKAAQGDSEKLSRLLNTSIYSENGVYSCELYFNSEWERVDNPDNADYLLILRSYSARSLRSADIAALRYEHSSPFSLTASDNDTIYQLSVKAYTGLEAAI